LRYSQIIDLVHEHKPRVIAEFGTWLGVRAVEMASAALEHNSYVYYIGFDLFDNATSETDEREFNVKKHAKLDEVTALLNKLKNENKGFRFDLIPGDTRELAQDVFADLVFIDGGHSIETIRSDYERCKKSRVIIFDDYYIPDENGKCPDIMKVGCNQLVDELNFDVLPSADRIKGGGLTAIAVNR